MPNQYRKGTVEITLRVPQTLKARLAERAAAQQTSVNRLIREALEQDPDQPSPSPARRLPRRKPRDPSALLALAWYTRQRVLKDPRFRAIGPRQWKLQ